MIQTKPVTNPHKKNILITNIYVDHNYRSFETPRKNNHRVTVPRAQILLGYNDAQPFETPRIKNHSVNAPSAQILLGDDNAHSFETPILNNCSVTAPSAHFCWVMTMNSHLKLPKKPQCNFTKCPYSVGIRFTSMSTQEHNSQVL